jgi:hypothetical protein
MALELMTLLLREVTGMALPGGQRGLARLRPSGTNRCGETRLSGCEHCRHGSATVN